MDRFTVIYRLSGDERDAFSKAQDICLEQTVEFPAELLPPGFIQEQVVGKIEDFRAEGEGGYIAVISFAPETAADELTQLLNVVFGNISIKPGYRVNKLLLPESLLNQFKGPAFGRTGLRELLKAPSRPLLFSALKPMGLASRDLADLAYQMARGGIDMIKDDHGLTDQPYAPFRERVRLCAEAVRKANRETGFSSIYLANITAPHREILDRARYARECGAGGLLVSPGLVGFDAMKSVSDEPGIGLPVIAHPAWLGTYVLHPDNGISHYTLFGQLARLAGADGTVYPNFGGRFSFSREECISIVRGTFDTMGHIKPIFPCPGGGMSMDTIPDMLGVYGSDVAFLIGGGLFRQGPDLVENCRYFRRLVDKTPCLP